jgi:hypothetical protein
VAPGEQSLGDSLGAWSGFRIHNDTMMVTPDESQRVINV